MKNRVVLRTRLILAAAGLLMAHAAAAGPYIWDQDENRIDDRIESVHLLGYPFSFEGADTTARQRFVVSRTAGGLAYGMYVVYAAPPTTADVAALTALGLPVLHRLEVVPALRTVGTFAQALLARDLPGVERIEVVPLVYAGLIDGAAAIGVRDPGQRLFPAWEDDPGAADGDGIIVAILDTGVNDAPEGDYPGHGSLVGRCMGGASFINGDSLLDTPRAGSVNPADHGGAVTAAHGTHVAGIVLGDGGASGFAPGIAPGARFVDVKTLGDAGIGTAVAEAIDWCVANRNRPWGDPDPAWRGIDVLNLSLSSLDPSDGNDVASRAAARAVELGLVVVASMGNDGKAAHVPSPAAGDGVLAVGAWDTARSGFHGDDTWPSSNNTGPRASDGDGDGFDELKPTLLAPGFAVLSADGNLASDGTKFRRGSGTSAAAGFVSGAAALLLAQATGLTPGELAGLLVATATRPLPAAPAGSAGPDPRWSSTRGHGLLDVRAARVERLSPGTSQVVRLELRGADSTVTAVLTTQRERGAAYFAIERAPDAGGAPGLYAAWDSSAASGVSSLADADNRAVYTQARVIPPGERGGTWWYRWAFTENAQRQVGPAVAFASPIGASAATIEVTVVHDAYDHDLDVVIEAAANPHGTPLLEFFPLPASGAAVETDWVDGVSATGNVSRTFRLEIPVGLEKRFLPPSPATPWTLLATEAGFLNRSGRIESFRLIHHAAGGDVTYEGIPSPAPTFEGGTTRVRIPAGVTGVEPLAVDPGLHAWPNPVSRGATLVLRGGAAAPTRLEVIDLAGRRVGRIDLQAAGLDRREGRWTAADDAGRALPAGVYFLRATDVSGGPALPRIVVLPR